MSTAQLAAVAGLLADRTRAAICVALLDGRAWTATELARLTGVAPSTMSEHLSRLLAGGLLIERRQGRHRYVELAGVEVAETLEQLQLLTEPRPEARSLRAVTATEAMTRARTCYDHFAGRLGVAIADAMVAKGLLVGENLTVTEAGRAWLENQLAYEPTSSRRPLSRACVDWTERRLHLAGAAGAHVCTTFLDRDWAVRLPSSRAVRLTPSGEQALSDLFGVSP